MTTVKLSSSDGIEIEVLVDVATKSETIKNLIEDTGVEVVIPLPNVSGKILTKIIEYCQYLVDHPKTPSNEPEQTPKQLDVSEWESEFIKVEQPTLFEIILAANYLDIKPLLDLSCYTVACMIKGKTPEEIRQTFGIENDFTPEEEEQIRKENEWCEER